MNTEPEDRPTQRHEPKRSWLPALIGVALIVGALAWILARPATTPEENQAVALTPAPAATPKPTEPPVPMPEFEEERGDLSPTVEEVKPELPPLPALMDSDPKVREALEKGLDAGLQPALKAEQLIPRATVVLQHLGKGTLLRDKLSLPSIPGTFTTEQHDQRVFIATANYGRYRAAVDAVTRSDASALAASFTYFEPLINAAWEQTQPGSPAPREVLMAILNELINADYPTEPPVLIQPSVFFKYEDPALEALSDGVKLMIRIGPTHRENLIDWLRELRAALRTD